MFLQKNILKTVSFAPSYFKIIATKAIVCVLVRKVFKINADATIDVNMVDNLATPITEEIFENVVDQFSKSGSFYINFNSNVVPSNVNTIVTSEVSQITCEF